MNVTSGEFFGLFGAEFASESIARTPMAVSGTLSNFHVGVDGGTAAGKNWILTVRKNGANTSVTCTVVGPATTCSDSTHTASFNAGEDLSISIVASGGPGSKPMSWSAKYTPAP